VVRRSPLDRVHRSLGAKMVPFGGWEMPLAYSSGTIEEHMACRRSAVVFDVSHLGTVRVSGASAFDSLQRVMTNDLRKVGPGRAQYTHLLDESDASVLDDIIVWWVSDDVFDVMPNASNTERVRDALAAVDDGGGLEVADTTAERAVLAVQGPQARSLLGSVVPDAADVGRFRVGSFSFEGAQCRVAGTGYTGEDGVECAVPVGVAESFWAALLGAGIVPAGLGARDTLRLEAALPLHGQELGPGISPLDAGLGWVVGWDKDDFKGRAALERQRERGPERVLRGLRTEGRRPPRAGQDVLSDGVVIGRVTSGNFSPVLACGIALAYVEPSVSPGDQLVIDVRGSDLPAMCVELPFIPRPSS
jgi:aminomethyltransferase